MIHRGDIPAGGAPFAFLVSPLVSTNHCSVAPKNPRLHPPVQEAVSKKPGRPRRPSLSLHERRSTECNRTLLSRRTSSKSPQHSALETAVNPFALAIEQTPRSRTGQFSSAYPIARTCSYHASASGEEQPSGEHTLNAEIQRQQTPAPLASQSTASRNRRAATNRRRSRARIGSAQTLRLLSDPPRLTVLAT